MNLRQRKSNISLMLIVMVVLALPVASYAGLLSNLLGSKTTTTSTTTSTSTTTATGGTTQPGLISQLLGSSGLDYSVRSAQVRAARPLQASALTPCWLPHSAPCLT